jgi:hypothetical protein
VGTQDRAGDQVAEHHRLAEPLEEDRRGRGHAQNQREIAEKFVGVGHSPNIGRSPGVSTG